MATYAIGDVQGCLEPLQRLLDVLRFDPARDRLWFVGDLVNRGGESLGVLRLVHSLRDCAVVVLGNHDLHLLAERIKKPERRQRSAELRAVLEAPDADILLDWLRAQPLLHHDPALDFAMVHAGIAPQWSLATAKQQAQIVERALRAPDYADTLLRMYGNKPRAWNRELKGLARLRACINVFTRMRYCDPRGAIEFDAKGPPGTQPAGYYPWFEVPGHKARETRFVCGHWSALGRFAGLGVYGIDTGCVWGGPLTALRLDGPEPQFIAVPSNRPKADLRALRGD
jgi:bis(5'-nucleosyl)-tetraphosphatase (symmetrical)